MNILVCISPDLLNQVGDLTASCGPLSSLNDVPWELAPAVKYPPAPAHTEYMSITHMHHNLLRT